MTPLSLEARLRETADNIHQHMFVNSDKVRALLTEAAIELEMLRDRVDAVLAAPRDRTRR